MTPRLVITAVLVVAWPMRSGVEQLKLVVITIFPFSEKWTSLSKRGG